MSRLYEDWTNEELNFLVQNHGKLTAKEIGDKLDRTYRSVEAMSQKLKITKPKQPNWTNEDVEWLKENFLKYSKSELAKKLNRTPSSIQNKANKLGLQRPEKYFYDVDYFESINTEEKAYWLGFIYADGYICQTERNCTLGIELAIRDIDHLKKFNKCINGNIPIETRWREPSDIVLKRREMCSIRLYRQKIVEDLLNQGLLLNKTYKELHLPSLQDNLIVPFIRGFFDGDGAIFSRHVNGHKDDTLASNITNASLCLLSEIKEYLYSKHIYSYISEQKNKKGQTIPIYQLNIRGMENCVDFLSLLYDDAVIYLDRKNNYYKRKLTEYDLLDRIAHSRNPKK